MIGFITKFASIAMPDVKKEICWFVAPYPLSRTGSRLGIVLYISVKTKSPHSNQLNSTISPERL
jgi:hypothetical protein